MKNGRTLGWESLSNTFQAEDIPVQFTSSAYITSGIQIRFRTLIPVNVTRGAVTLVRIHGQMQNFFDGPNMALLAGEGAAIATYNIQLIPVRDGAIQATSVLNPRNSADLESNRILWRRSYTPRFSEAPLSNLDQDRVMSQMQTDVIDIKTQRRFDRATWALIIVSAFEATTEDDHRVGFDLRGLFRTTDGL